MDGQADMPLTASTAERDIKKLEGTRYSAFTSDKGLSTAQ